KWRTRGHEFPKARPVKHPNYLSKAWGTHRFYGQNPAYRPTRLHSNKSHCVTTNLPFEGLGGFSRAFWAKALLRKLAKLASELYEFGALFWISPESSNPILLRSKHFCNIALRAKNGPKPNKRQMSNPSQLLQLKRSILIGFPSSRLTRNLKAKGQGL
ncbi:hypothetical protein PIB30_098554, partial [Stylosanthes scabra]|nr:hypothetical protein [Stylosanthes scabra]